MSSVLRAEVGPTLAPDATTRVPRVPIERIVLAVLLLPGLAWQLSGASKPKVQWVIDASRLTGESPNLTPPEPVWGLAFSPDETQLAIGLGSHPTSIPRIRTGHVVVVSALQPEKVLHRFEIRGSPGSSFPGNLVWAPSGRSLAVYTVDGTTVFSLDGRQLWNFPGGLNFAGFLSGDRTVTYDRIGPDRVFEVRLPDGTTEETWRSPDRFAFALATCPEAGLVGTAWFSEPGAKSAGIEVVGYPGHEAVLQLAGSLGTLGHNILFADSCRLVCAGQPPSKGFANHAACWDIRTGEIAVEARSVTFGWMVGSYEAAGREWVASTVYNVGCHLGKFWDFIDEAGCWEQYKRLVVWSVKGGVHNFGEPRARG